MSKERPYEFISLYALVYLAEHYKQLVNEGYFKFQKELNLIETELEIRFKKPEEDRQITIEEYMRSRKNGK